MSGPSFSPVARRTIVRSSACAFCALLVAACSGTPAHEGAAARLGSPVERPEGPGAQLLLPSAMPSPAAAVAASAAPPQPPRPARSPFAYANDDPDDDFVVAPPEPRADCHEALTAAGVQFADAKIAVHREGKGKTQLTCGADQIVVYRKSAAGITYEPTPIVTCTMALALAHFDAVLEEEATRAFGERVVRVTQLGTYACREMAAYRGWVSEHSYANAIDVETFELKSGKRVSVLAGFERGDETHTRAGGFLRAVSRRTYDEGLFSNVLTPFFDALHRNHFHLDLARYRNDGTRPSPEAL